MNLMAKLTASSFGGLKEAIFLKNSMPRINLLNPAASETRLMCEKRYLHEFHQRIRSCQNSLNFVMNCHEDVE